MQGNRAEHRGHPRNGPSRRGLIYDADDNLVSDGGSQSWVWNGENQLAAYQVTGPTQSAQYIYDGLGRRVEKTVDGVTTLYLRAALGPVADEVTDSTWTDSVNVPGAEQVAPIRDFARGPADGSPGTAATVAWLHADQVGTTRVLTDQNGNNLVQFFVLRCLPPGGEARAQPSAALGH